MAAGEYLNQVQYEWFVAYMNHGRIFEEAWKQASQITATVSPSGLLADHDQYLYEDLWELWKNYGDGSTIIDPDPDPVPEEPVATPPGELTFGPHLATLFGDSATIRFINPAAMELFAPDEQTMVFQTADNMLFKNTRRSLF